MCWAIPGKIIELKGEVAVIQIENVMREISVKLLPDSAVGDYVVVHAGYALEKMRPEDAELTMQVVRDMKL
jgi:hydrogenase expression/formation protein HypC